MSRAVGTVAVRRPGVLVVWALCLALSAACTEPVKKSELPTGPVESGFALEQHAFAFPNFGGPGGGSTVNADLAARLFGEENICAAMTNEGCRPTPIAREWMKKVNESMKGGRCEGFAVLSSLMHLGQVKPEDFGAADARALTLDGNDKLKKEIAYWFSTQYLNKVVGESTQAMTAKEAVIFLAAEFAKPDRETHRIGIVRVDEKGKIRGGHAITPIGVAPGATAGTYVIRVYDNNHPTEVREIKVDAEADRWEYQASTDPSKESALYMGDAKNDNPLYVTAVRPRLGKHPCGFCSGKDEGSTPATNQVFNMGSADVTASTPSGKTAGVANGRIVNDVPGATVVPNFTDTWDDDAPFSMTVPGGDGRTSFAVVGRSGGEPVHLAMFGRGRVAGADGALIPEGSVDRMAVGNTSGSVSYNPSAGSTPKVFLAQQTLQGTQTLVQVQIPADAGVSSVSMDVALDGGNATISARGEKDTELSVEITRSGADKEDVFEGVIEAPPEGSVEFDVAAWQGEGTAIPAVVDRDGDGVPDESVSVPPTGSMPMPPQAPAMLVAVASGPNALTLTWVDQSATEERFEIERDALGGGLYVPLTQVPFNVTTVMDAAVRHSTSYRYRVRAVNRYGASAWSNEAELTLPGCAAGTQDNDNDGLCAPNCAAAGLTCGNVGNCSDSSGAAACVCDTGYAGNRCERCSAGYQDFDFNGSCLPNCQTANQTCTTGNGTCSEASGAPVCACTVAHTGPECASCATGYQDLDLNGRCEPTCATAMLNCSGFGSCEDTTGTPRCECSPGHAGANCSACAPGYQDNDLNGSCEADCTTASLACGPAATCNDSAGTASCICPAGSLWLGTYCHASVTVELEAVADSYVVESTPTATFGTSPTLDVSGGVGGNVAHALLKFDLNGIPADAEIRAVELQATAFVGFPVGADPNIYTHEHVSSTWDEGTVSWANAPAVNPTALGSARISLRGMGPEEVVINRSGALVPVVQAKVGVSSVPVSFRLSAPDTGGRFHSREAATAAHRPKLRLTYTQPVTVTIEAEADAEVSASSPTTNYGTQPSFQAQPGDTEAYLRFDLAAVPQGATLTSAELRATAYTGFAYGGDGNVYAHPVSDDAWVETAITWNTRPPAGPTPMGFWWLWYNGSWEQTGSNSDPALRTWAQGEVNGDRKASIRLHSPGYLTVYFSREHTEAAKRPQLILRYH